MGIFKGSSIYNSFDAGGGGGGFEDVTDQLEILISGTVELKAYKSGSFFIAFFKRSFTGSHTSQRWMNFFKIKNNANFVFSSFSSNMVQIYNSSFDVIIEGKFVTVANHTSFPPPDYTERLVDVYSPYSSESFCGSFLAPVKDL